MASGDQRSLAPTGLDGTGLRIGLVRARWNTELVERLQAPVFTRRQGHGVVDSRHPLWCPLTVGREFWRDADVVVGVGTRMAEPSSLPSISGRTSFRAFAAPVEVGIIAMAAERARYRSLWRRSSVGWSPV